MPVLARRYSIDLVFVNVAMALRGDDEIIRSHLALSPSTMAPRRLMRTAIAEMAQSFMAVESIEVSYARRILATPRGGIALGKIKQMIRLHSHRLAVMTHSAHKCGVRSTRALSRDGV